MSDYETIAVGDLHPHKDNYRHHPPAQIDALVASFRASGLRKPVVAWRDADGAAIIVAGHGIWEAAKQAGLERIGVRWFTGSAAAVKHYLVADNELSRLARDDATALAELLAELRAEGGLEGTGWADDDLDELLAKLAAKRDLKGVDDEPPAPEKEVFSLPGTIYQLGPHRLACGDSTDAALWAALVPADQQIDVIWSDPPYGVAYVGGTKEKLTIKNDNLDEGGLRALIDGSMTQAFGRLTPDGTAYIASPSGPLFLQFASVLTRFGWRADMQWVKDALVLGRSDFHPRHEAIFWCSVDPERPIPDKTEWYIDRPRRNTEHPTMKPIELVAAMLTQADRPGGKVVDPFGGSGSTLIAAESVGMRCYTIELDPRYADVIRRRWARLAKLNGLDVGDGLEDAA